MSIPDGWRSFHLVWADVALTSTSSTFRILHTVPLDAIDTCVAYTKQFEQRPRTKSGENTCTTCRWFFPISRQARSVFERNEIASLGEFSSRRHPHQLKSRLPLIYERLKFSSHARSAPITNAVNFANLAELLNHETCCRKR
jgi:hypothetical protein